MKLSSPTRRRNEFLKMLDNTSENDEYDDNERSIASDGLIKTTSSTKKRQSLCADMDEVASSIPTTAMSNTNQNTLEVILEDEAFLSFELLPSKPQTSAVFTNSVARRIYSLRRYITICL